MRNNYIVEYYEGAIPQYFICHADDAKHAEEQCINAYPDAAVGKTGEISWIMPNVEKAYDRFFGL